MGTLGAEHNVVIGACLPADMELFFGPLTAADSFVVYPNAVRWPTVLKDLGVFKSTSDARRNGWDKDIPMGFSDIRIGKLKTRITVLRLV